MLVRVCLIPRVQRRPSAGHGSIENKHEQCAQSSLTLQDPMDCSPPGSSVHGIFQVKNIRAGYHFLLRGSSWPKNWTWVSYISCTGRQILYRWATGEAPENKYRKSKNRDQLKRPRGVTRGRHCPLKKVEIFTKLFPQLGHQLLRMQKYFKTFDIWNQSQHRDIHIDLVILMLLFFLSC